MGLAINRCLKKVLKHLYISNMEDTIEHSLYDNTTNKEDILNLVVYNQNFKDYVSIRDILMKTVSYALEHSDYIYFAKCMGCTLTAIKKFQLLKDTLIQMVQDVKNFLKDAALQEKPADEPMSPEEKSGDNTKVMLYCCLTALSKVHILNVSAISSLVSEVLEADYFTEEEKGKFCVDIILHNFMRPFHCSRIEEEQYYWNLFIDKTNKEVISQVLGY